MIHHLKNYNENDLIAASFVVDGGDGGKIAASYFEAIFWTRRFPLKLLRGKRPVTLPLYSRSQSWLVPCVASDGSMDSWTMGWIQQSTLEGHIRHGNLVRRLAFRLDL